MARFHRTTDGQVGACTASLRACPYGKESHFDSQAEAVAATHATMPIAAPLRRRPAHVLLARENTLVGAARRERLDVHEDDARHVASREEVFFMENGRESGNGVVVTKLYNGTTRVRLPILYEADGKFTTVDLKLRPGQKAGDVFKKFLDGVEHEPPDSYRLFGTYEEHSVRTKLSTEHYARLRAALRASESIIAEPLPERPASRNQELIDILRGGE
ncbi:hypothetical protein [Microbacterium sp. SORGH_AS_0888]|uniref:hypothetical protein n=1 Tax=Microbacterium sp. SORGH_AS_0888 TaxID=3041791 RepID=UPI00278A3385|nr:hypothetical protein [Microbacterium sp. SORGH_AS_0888]MDQ1130935.1 hypothetical protein [Microbacterium sp. SORGH_AS_0888]